MAPGNPHITVFANWEPKDCLSPDRWNIIRAMDDSVKLHEMFPPDKYPDIVNVPDPFEDEAREEFANSHGLPAGTGFAGPIFRPPLMLDAGGVAFALEGFEDPVLRPPAPLPNPKYWRPPCCSTWPRMCICIRTSTPNSGTTGRCCQASRCYPR